MARVLLAAMLACVAALAAAQAVPVPKLTARVIDQTATLSEAQRGALEEKLAAFERLRGSQVAVLLVPTTGGETIEDFATRVTDAWQLGRKRVDDGVLFVVAKQDRKMRIHTGRGVQGTLTDALSKRIVSDIVSPRFRSGDFAGGIDAGVDAILKAVAGEELPQPAAEKRHGGASLAAGAENLFILAFFVVPFVGLILRNIFGRFFGAGITSGITGVAAWLLLGSLAIGMIAAIVAFLFTLSMGGGIARGARSGGWVPIGGWGGGGWSGGGGGGGGFSGGGGSFDGGGASGSW